MSEITGKYELYEEDVLEESNEVSGVYVAPGDASRGIVINTVDDVVKVSHIVISTPASSINVGEMIQLSATAYPTYADNTRISWESGNTAIASVGTGNGRVKGVSAGNVWIYAQAQDGSGAMASIMLTVVANAGSDTIVGEDDNGGYIPPEDNTGDIGSTTVPDTEDTNIPVESIIISPKEETLYIGDTLDLSVEIHPENATYQKILWSSEDPEIAIVGSSNGRVLAKSAGTTTIYAIARDGSGVYDCCVINVNELKVEMVPAVLAVKDCYVRINTLINNNVSDTRLKNSNGGSIVLRASECEKIPLLQTNVIVSNGIEWYQIIYNGMIAYVTADSFVKTTMPKPSLPTGFSMQVDTVDGMNLNIRNKPYISGDLLGQFADKSIIEIINKTPQNGIWFAVYGQAIDGTYTFGWCSGDYLKSLNSTPTNASADCVRFIANYEQFCPEPVDDGYGNMTIGFGHMIKEGEVFSKISESEALELLSKDMIYAENMVTNHTNSINASWKQHQYDAFVSLAYNAGTWSNYVMDQIVLGVNPHDAFSEISNANGEFSLGLYRRRMDEADMFVYGTYNRTYREAPNG